MNPENLHWKSEYEIGIPEVDFQHQYFLEMIRRLHHRRDEGLSREAVAAHLKEVLYYTNFHFLSESNLMNYYGYTEVRDHQDLHEEISTKLLYEIMLFERDRLEFSELVDFLVHWFIDHTVQEDRKFGVYVLANFPDGKPPKGASG